MARPGGWITSVGGVLLIGVAIGAGAMAGWQAWRGPDRAATEAIVRNYVLNHGEILPEAMKRLQDRQAAASVTRHRSAIETPYHGAWAGAENGDVVLVQFFDYACPYCRDTNADVDRLLAEDRRLKVVWRELPVLGPNSEAAAQASLAAARQGRFRQFHERLFALGRPTEAVLAQAMAEAGVTAEATPPEAAAELARNTELARAVEATGTPTFVVGNQVLQGAVGYEALKAAIAEARRGRS
jgi:protein-disulfide isomerase